MLLLTQAGNQSNTSESTSSDTANACTAMHMLNQMPHAHTAHWRLKTSLQPKTDWKSTNNALEMSGTRQSPHQPNMHMKPDKQPISDTSSRITNLLMSLKSGDKCALLQQPTDLAFILDEAAANHQNHVHPWLHTDQMHFMPEFNPSKIEQWGPQIEDSTSTNCLLMSDCNVTRSLPSN